MYEHDGEQNGGYQVVWPLSKKAPVSETAREYSGTLDGQRIGFIWDYLFCGEEIFDEVKRRLSEDFDSVSFVDHETFGNVHGPDEDEKVAALPGLLRTTRVSSVVVAVGA